MNMGLLIGLAVAFAVVCTVLGIWSFILFFRLMVECIKREDKAQGFKVLMIILIVFTPIGFLLYGLWLTGDKNLKKQVLLLTLFSLILFLVIAGAATFFGASLFTDDVKKQISSGFNASPLSVAVPDTLKEKAGLVHKPVEGNRALIGPTRTVLTLRNGNTIRGKLVRRTETQIKLMNYQMGLIVFGLNEVYSIRTVPATPKEIAQEKAAEERRKQEAKLAKKDAKKNKKKKKESEEK